MSFADHNKVRSNSYFVVVVVVFVGHALTVLWIFIFIEQQTAYNWCLSSYTLECYIWCYIKKQLAINFGSSNKINPQKKGLPTPSNGRNELASRYDFFFQNKTSIINSGCISILPNAYQNIFSWSISSPYGNAPNKNKTTSCITSLIIELVIIHWSLTVIFMLKLNKSAFIFSDSRQWNLGHTSIMGLLIATMLSLLNTNVYICTRVLCG